MKQNQIANYLKLGILLFGISFLFTNCEKDFTHDVEFQKKSRFNVETLNHKQIESNSKIVKKLNEIKPKKIEIDTTNSQLREIYNEQYGFTINTNFVKYLEDTETGNHSYSFPISRHDAIDDKVENLLLHANMENGYDAYIIKYSFTVDEYVNFDENSAINYETNLTPIDYDVSVFNSGEFSKVVYDCVETWEWSEGIPHDGLVHGASCTCNPSQGWFLTGISCGYFDDVFGEGEDGTTYNNESGGGGGGTGSPNGPTNPDNHDPRNPVVSAPAMEPAANDPLTPEQIDQKNCEELAKLTSNPPAGQTNPFTVDGTNLDPTGNNTYPRTAIINASSNSNFEHGYGLYNQGQFNTYGPYAKYTAGISGQHVFFPGSPFQFGTIHMHPYGSTEIPMFSHDDIYSLLQIKNQYAYSGALNPSGDAIFVGVLAVNQGGQIHTYAIKIEDPTKLLNLNDYKTSNRDWDKFGEDLRSRYTDDANGVDGSATDYQRAFLNLVKDLELGVSLYKMKPNNLNNPNELETWGKLSLNNNGTLANPKPCN